MANKKVFWPIESVNDVPTLLGETVFTSGLTALQLAQTNPDYRIICGFIGDPDAMGNLVPSKFLETEIDENDPLPDGEFLNTEAEAYDLPAEYYTPMYVPVPSSTTYELWGGIPVRKPHR